jgi:hypothetical protein
MSRARMAGEDGMRMSGWSLWVAGTHGALILPIEPLD